MGDARPPARAPQSRCPVCGDGFEVPPRSCPRCAAPHHSDCWEYTPGCAVYACADTAPPDQAARSLLHRVLALRLHLLRLAAWVLVAAVLYGCLGFMLTHDLGAPVRAFLLAFSGGVLVAAATALQLWCRWRGPELQLATQGSRELKRIRDSVLERTGSPLVVSPLRMTGILWAAITAALAIQWFGPFPAAILIAFGPFLAMTLCNAVLCLLFVYPVLALVSRLSSLGSIELRRVEAALEGHRPDKVLTIGE